MPRRSLKAYRTKRDFERTPEPAGATLATDGRSFVVQKHAASRLHYDFRLELDGVLLSWAVPKGPSLDPKQRRLAVRTEDHPIDYGSFEGVIPRGEYGGGTVLLWDRGSWEPLEDPQKGLAEGKLHFQLHGERLRGRFRLVRTKDEKAWLLIKSKDEQAHEGEDDAIVKQALTSVASARTMDEIASDPDRVWHSERDNDAIASTERSAAERGVAINRGGWGGSPPRMIDLSEVEGAKRRALPKTLMPELATLVDGAPTGEKWVHEIKLDGYRILARIQDNEVRLFTRRGNDWTARLPSLARVLSALPVRAAWLDGEIVVVDKNGRTDFGSLQNAFSRGRDTEVRYFVFDLPYLDEFDLRGATLLERKRILSALLSRAGAQEGRIRYSDHVRGDGERFFEQACSLGVEGIMSKRADSTYVARRTKDWRKVKCLRREEAVVGGFTDPSGRRTGIGALLLGQRVDTELRFIGKVGTGFDARTLRELYALLSPLEIAKSPFANPPRARGVHWARPEVVVEVAYAERTKDGKLRQPSFLGVREDKSAEEVREERPAKKKSSFGGVRLSSPDKVFFPDLGMTKRELAEYYETVAERLLPHLVDRPLTLFRCPDGIDQGCFYQKHILPGMPKAIVPVQVNEEEPHMTVRDLAGLISLVQFGVLEIHTWGSRFATLERPDQLVFDLDPAVGLPWSAVVRAAFDVRERLSALGLTSFLKSTGGKGLHVVVPVAPKIGWDEIKAFTHALAQDLVRAHRGRYTTTITKAKRKGKVLLDYLRNVRGATAVCVYSTRAKEGAPVSVPLAWDEVAPEPLAFGPREMIARLNVPDPWEDFSRVRQSITKAMRAELGLD